MAFFTKAVRKGYRVPAALVVIMDDGSGNVLALDTAKLKARECPIVLWDHESADGSKQVPGRVARDFGSWLEQLLS